MTHVNFVKKNATWPALIKDMSRKQFSLKKSSRTPRIIRYSIISHFPFFPATIFKLTYLLKVQIVCL